MLQFAVDINCKISKNIRNFFFLVVTDIWQSFRRICFYHFRCAIASLSLSLSGTQLFFLRRSRYLSISMYICNWLVDGWMDGWMGKVQPFSSHDSFPFFCCLLRLALSGGLILFWFHSIYTYIYHRNEKKYRPSCVPHKCKDIAMNWNDRVGVQPQRILYLLAFGNRMVDCNARKKDKG